MAELTRRQNVDNIFHSLFSQHMEAIKNKTAPRPLTEGDFSCYKQLVDMYSKHCGQAEDYTLKYFGAFVAECKNIQYYPEQMEVLGNKM